MHPHRTTLLLILLVLTPLALLTWLGTYLIRDAARSTETAMQAVLAERLAVADHQLVDDLRRFTDQLDRLASESVNPREAASSLAGHGWTQGVWVVEKSGAVQTVVAPPAQAVEAGAEATARSKSLQAALKQQQSQPTAPDEVASPFYQLPSGEDANGGDATRRARWLTFARSDAYSGTGLDEQVPAAPFKSGWHVTDGDFIYWRSMSGEGLVCVRMDSRRLRHALYARLPPLGLQPYPGRLTLSTVTGIPLHTSGRLLAGSQRQAVAFRQCSAPLTQWRLAYSPAYEEFPKPYLFPILLGVGSGILLVLALAWTFFRENARELRLAQQRVSFVNQISHELKTPLTNIQLYSEMASHRLEDSGDTVAQRHLRVVETETARLNRLIQNVLNYARQQRDKLCVHLRPVVLDDVVNRVVGNWRVLLENKGFQIHLKLAGPPMMEADADALEQILGNLLSNVDKYATHGKWLAIYTENAGSGVRIVVEDRGPGIPSGKRRSVFEPFERLRSDLNEGVSGTGIGLTISRELAELHGGSLEVCSLYKDGARFILTLPVHSL